jgi:hypothetical protein
MSRGWARRSEQNSQQVANLSSLDKGMTEGKIRHHLVVVPPSASLPQHIAAFDELREDPMRGALGDPNRRSDIA